MNRNAKGASSDREGSAHVSIFNRNIPLWYQLAQHLRDQIATGELPRGARLPTDRELAKQYNVSVITVRQALARLVASNMIVRERGRGTFITAKPAMRRELSLFGSADTVIDQQMAEETETELLERRPTAVPRALTDYFPGIGEVTLFRRLRREQGAPFSYLVDYTVPDYARQVPDDLVRKHTMITIFRDVLGIKLRRIKLSISATGATADVARRLEIDIASPVLRFFGVASDTAGRVIGLTHIYYRADRFQFTVDIDVGRSGRRQSSSATTKWAFAENAMPTSRTAPLS